MLHHHYFLFSSADRPKNEGHQHFSTTKSSKSGLIQKVRVSIMRELFIFVFVAFFSSPIISCFVLVPNTQTRSHLCAITDNNERTTWYTCCSTRELVKATELFVREDDVVAEVGAQLRDVSNMIAAKCQSAVMVDIERKFPKDSKDRTSAMRRRGDEAELQDHVAFGEMQSLSDWRKALFFQYFQGQPYDVFVLDVSAVVGNDLEWTSFSIVQEFLALNECLGGHCRTVLIKSAGLNSLASRLVHGKVWMDREPSKQVKRTTILGTVGVQEYRSTMEHAVLPGDAVLEVGCHFGTSTTQLHEAASPRGYCIGVDVGASIVEGAKKKYPHVYFDVGDAWKTAELLRIQQDYLGLHPETDARRTGFDVVYVDVGGLSGSDGVLEALTLLSSLEKALEPRCLVIKSQCMRRLSTTLTSFWQSPERREYDRLRKEERTETKLSS